MKPLVVLSAQTLVAGLGSNTSSLIRIRTVLKRVLNGESHTRVWE